MADLQISGLPALAEAGIEATDVLALADLSASETKKVTVKDLVARAAVLLDSGDIPAAKVATPFAADAVATATIQDLAVTAAKIANATITATQITDATITGAKLANDTVTATQIAANAIGSSELADNAVDTAALAANAVTTAKITDANVTYAKLNLSDGDIPGAKIASGGITATQLATNSVTATELADNAVDTAAVANAAITGAKIASQTIAAGNIVNNTITGTQIADGAIGTDQIANNAITTAKLSGTISAGTITDGAVGTTKLADDAVTSTKLAANAVDATALADNAVDSGAIASNAVIEAKIAANAVTVTKIADGTITPAKLNTSNLDRSLNVASGNLGINNAVSGGASTRSGISFNAEGLITGTVALAAGDLPVATTSAVGGVSIASAGGLSVTGAGALSIAATTTGATATKVTFNNFGQITGTGTLAAADIPKATASAVGGVSVPTGGPLSVDGNGALTVSDSGVTAGTNTKVTVDAKGRVTALAALSDSDLPNHSAALLTSGTLNAARIGTDTIDGTKLSNSSTTIIQSIAQLGYPTALFTGQLLFDPIAEDAYLWDGNAWNPITTLTKGALVRLGTYNANLSQVDYVTAAGSAAGLTVGQNLPVASESVDGGYVVISVQGTPSGIAGITGQLSPPDYLLGVTASATSSSWVEIDLSTTVASQQASAISYTPYGQLSATNVQAVINEIEDEKLAKAGGTVTGELLIGNAGSLVFEGTTADAFETRLTVADPTTSDKVITLPNVTGTVITTGDTGTVTSAMIADGSIVNADVNASAAIALTKLQGIASAKIIVGNSSGVATEVAVTGDIAISNTGVTSIAAGAIVNADISGSAAIAGSKIASGSTSAAGVLQLVDSTTSTSTSLAATGASVKAAKDAADAAATTANAALATTGGVLTGHLTLDDEKELRFREEDAGGDHYIALKAAAALAADVTLTLPAAAPTPGQVLKANASTPTNLEWATDSANAAGSNTQVQFNNSGAFAGSASLTFNSGTGALTATSFVGDLTGTASSFTVTANNSTDETVYPLFSDGATGSQGAETDTGLTYNPSTGLLTSTGFSGSGASLTSLNASNLGSGTVATARLGTGTASASNYLRGDGSWQAVPSGVSLTGSTNNTIATVTGANALQGEANLTFDGTSLVAETTIQVQGGSGDTLLNLHRTNAAGSDGNNFGAIKWTDNNSNEVASIRGQRATAVDDANLTFFTRNTGGSATERMRIDSSGKVGIGETSMDALLVIKGDSDANTTPSIRLKDGSDTRECWISNTSGDLVLANGGNDNTPHCTLKMFDGNIMQFNTANTERMRINSSGNVGIGDTSPGNLLTVAGRTETRSITGHEGTNTDLQIASGHASSIIAFSIGQFGVSASEKFRIGASGQLGIGGATYGDAGQVLTSGGANAAPTWADAAGGGGGTVELTANGSIAANTAVIVRSDGDVEDVAETVTLNTVVGSEFDTGNGNQGQNSVAYDPNKDQWVTAYCNVYQTQGYPYYRISDSNDQFGSANQLLNEKCVATDLVYEDDEEAMVVFYVRNAGTPRGVARVLYSKTNNSVGNALEFYEAFRSFGCVYDPDSGKILGHFQRQESTPYLNVLQQLTVSGNGLTDNGEITITTDRCDFGSIAVGNGFVLVSYQKENSKTYVKAYKWGGSSYTASSEVQVYTNDVDHSALGYCIKDSKFVIAIRDNDSSNALRGAFVTVTESGGTPSISVGTVSNAGEPTNTDRPRLYYDTGIGELVAYYVGGSGSAARAKVKRVDSTGSNFAWISGETSMGSSSQNWPAGNRYNPIAYGTVDTKAMALWHDNNQTKATTVSLGSSVTNLTASNFIGFSNENATANDATCTVNVVGNTTTQSGLTPGQKYYITNAGGLSTTAGTPSVEAGVAIAANKLLIK